MKILSLRTAGFLGLPDGSYELGTGDEPAGLVVVTGAGPCGKTSLLEAIVAAKELVGPYGRLPAAAGLVRRGAARATLVARWVLDDAERAVYAGLVDRAEEASRRAREIEADASGSPVAEAKPEPPPRVVETEVVIDADAGTVERPRRLEPVFSRYDRAPTSGKAEYFPADRRMRPTLWREPGPTSRERDEAAPRLGRDLGKYGFVGRFLRDLAAASAERLQGTLVAAGVVTRGEEADELAPFKQALAPLAKDLRLLRVELSGALGADVVFVRRDRREVELGALSDSEADAVLFAATFVRQGLEGSLVLVDRPELYQDPKHAGAFVRGLAGLGHNQLVVATSTPEHCDGIEGALRLDLEARRG
ncbi:MAG: hypothetical protein IT373_15070 [Polyangiaceae bacterium]|nr:hypothetical protein [Polyangiaceae bacterium]